MNIRHRDDRFFTTANGRLQASYVIRNEGGPVVGYVRRGSGPRPWVLFDAEGRRQVAAASLAELDGYTHLLREPVVNVTLIGDDGSPTTYQVWNGRRAALASIVERQDEADASPGNIFRRSIIAVFLNIAGETTQITVDDARTMLANETV